MKYSEEEVRKAVLQGQIDVLDQLNYTTAYNGELSKLKQSTYVVFADVVKLRNEKRTEIRKYINIGFKLWKVSNFNFNLKLFKIPFYKIKIQIWKQEN
jgi:hypothetical protein